MTDDTTVSSTSTERTATTRSQALAEELVSLWVAIDEATKVANELEALQMLFVMIETAEEYPQIEAFSFAAAMEWDDESSYFWTASFAARIDGEECHDVEYWDRLHDFQSSEVAVLAAFGVETWAGELTIAEIREKIVERGETWPTA